MRWRVLNMADLTACPGIVDILAPVAETVSLPADPAVFADRIAEFDGYFASLTVRLDAALLARAARLKVIATPSTGTDHIDLAAARPRGITVLSLKDETAFLDSVTATAELAWALLLATVRRLPAAVAAARAGHWGRDAFRGHQLAGKTLGILGYGRLGRMVAAYGQSFRMRVLACDIRPVAPAPGVALVDFDTLLRESDVLSIHVHLTPDNRGLIDAAALARMKPGAVLVNTSRGAIVDEPALLAALAAGRLAGAGLDVIDGEWDTDLAAHPLVHYSRDHENLVITPHVGGVTFESQALAYTFTMRKLRAFLESLPPA